MDAALRANATLGEVLSLRARSVSLPHLVFEFTFGLLAASAIDAFFPGRFRALVYIALCFASFGGWGIADRARDQALLTPRPRLAELLMVVRTSAMLAGAASAVALAFTLYTAALGRWQS